MSSTKTPTKAHADDKKGKVERKQDGVEGEKDRSRTEVEKKDSNTSFPLRVGRPEDRPVRTWKAIFGVTLVLLLAEEVTRFLGFSQIAFYIFNKSKLLDLPFVVGTSLPTLAELIKYCYSSMIKSAGETLGYQILSTRFAQIFNVVFYFVNFAVVASGGRIDSRFSKERGGVPADDEYRSLVTPAGWAFAIWGIIFGWELLFVLYQCTSWAQTTPWFGTLSVFWCLGCFYQMMWCFTFREWARPMFWISALMLTGIAASLYQALKTLPSASLTWTQSLMIKAPISIHCGWVSAAALVNWNTYFALLVRDCHWSPAAATSAAFISILLATAAGCMVVTSRLANFYYAAVIIWALTAIKSYTRNNLKEKDGGTDDVAMGAIAVTADIGAKLVALAMLFTGLLYINFYYMNMV